MYFTKKNFFLVILTVVLSFNCAESNNKSADLHCSCPKDMDLLCGSDGVSYTNRCQFECYQKVDIALTLKHEGQC